MVAGWVRVRRVGTPKLSTSSTPSPRNIHIGFAVAPKPPGRWIHDFNEAVWAGSDVPGKLYEPDRPGDNASGFVSSTKDAVADAITKLDQIIQNTNDRFEAFQAEAAAAEAENRALADELHKQRIAEQTELDALAEKFAKPPYEPE